MRQLALIVVLGVVVALSGCAGNRINYNQASMNLALGMEKHEVREVLGAPRRTDVNESRERWIYWNPAMMGFTPIDNEALAPDRLVVTFEGGKVTRWGDQTLADDMMEASQKTMESSYRMMQQAQPPSQQTQ